jgi:hypothetical protein
MFAFNFRLNIHYYVLEVVKLIICLYSGGGLIFFLRLFVISWIAVGTSKNKCRNLRLLIGILKIHCCQFAQVSNVCIFDNPQNWTAVFKASSIWFQNISSPLYFGLIDGMFWFYTRQCIFL